MITNESAKTTEKDMRLGNASLIFSRLQPQPKRYENEKRVVILLGSPVWRDKVDYETVRGRLLNEDITGFIREINGSFLFIVHDKYSGDLAIANDRFASIPLYYRLDGDLFTSATNYSDIWKRFSGLPNFKLNEEAFYEFLTMNRLFGDKTYDCSTCFLDSASMLRYSPNTSKVVVDKYWRPDFKKSDISVNEAAFTLATLIKRSFNRATSDSKRYGLLLSGGLDSRAVLAASDKTLTCFTTCEYENNEYKVAKELSRTKGYPHYFITKPATYYSDIIDRATYLSGMMSVYINAHFLNLKEAAEDKVDVLLHGYGFDFLFQGKYLPTHSYPLVNRISYKRKLVPLDSDSKDDVAKFFVDKMSSRSKSFESIQLLKENKRQKVYDLLYAEIRNLIDEAAAFTDNPYDWWDYCYFHNISRHYTWLNLTSIRDFMEERTVAFDNDLFDFFWSLEPALRAESNMFVKTIKLLNPALFAVRNANTNLSLDNSAPVESAKLLLNKILYKTHLNKVFTKSLPPPSTSANDRSWPNNADLIRSNENIRKITSGLCKSSGLENLNFLDMDAVSSRIREHLDFKKEHTDLILTLLTIDTFLSSNKRDLV